MTKSSTPEQKVKYDKAMEYFSSPKYDFTEVIGNIDFCVSVRVTTPDQRQLFGIQSLLWAEAKRGNSDVYKSFVQLILTIGKARTFNEHLPPPFLGAFDEEKIAFVPYCDVQDIFYQNDFNWNTTPSNYETKEFKQLYTTVKRLLDTRLYIFDWKADNKDLRHFIYENFKIGDESISRIKVNKNNFIAVYNKWLKTVKPTIDIDWEIAQQEGIIACDFFLADLISNSDESIKGRLFVTLHKTYYETCKNINKIGLFQTTKVFFKDKQKAHIQFWNKYERPPKEEYWDYIVGRRDLLVPQDIRERKGSFYTPQIWVELSQKYLADVLGEDWQDEYYIWDCAAGTGNLLAGLTNKRRIWASTLDRQDVDVMHDRIKNGANLLEDNVFQFDFLNDDFSKLPKDLQDVINNPKTQEKLVIYINPPYAEATSAKTVSGTGKNKAGVTKDNKILETYKAKIGNASNEIFALFMAKIYDKLPLSKLALFSKLKFVQGTNFAKFRDFFLADFLGGFVVRADTFDNVVGNFPIGFTMWDLSVKNKIGEIECDAIARYGMPAGKKKFYGELPQSINKWIKLYDNGSSEHIAYMENPAPDFQNNKFLNISTKSGTRHVNYFAFTKNNILKGAIYFAVRQVIPSSWLNDRDQFLFPDAGWENDSEFQNDCLAYMLFHGQNRISATEGTNHWIPFTENEADTRSNFESDFMSRFIAGKLKDDENHELFQPTTNTPKTPLVFSPEAQEVFEAGKALWHYYHQVIKSIPYKLLQQETLNASLYDIRVYFQGRNEFGKLSSYSADETYTALIGTLREKLKDLAKKIEPKVYQYGFLKA